MVTLFLAPQIYRYLSLGTDRADDVSPHFTHDYLWVLLLVKADGWRLLPVQNLQLGTPSVICSVSGLTRL